MKNESVIQVNNIQKSYYNLSVLNGVSFKVNKGCFCALLGENGVGKSTMINILMGHETPDIGSGAILGQDLNRDLNIHKSKIGLVTEKINYDIPIKVGQFFKRYAAFFPNWDNELFIYLMKERSLSLDKEFSEFSRGQKMQIALIAALSIRPELLLIDEVTSVLDVYARKFFMEKLKQFTNQGGTVLLTTNIISEVQHVTDKIILINNGCIQVDKLVEDIPKEFTKIRDAADPAHSIFKHKQCFWSGKNSDGSSSYIIPNGLLSEFELPSELYDRRSITLDEIFIFFVKTGVSL